MKILDVVLPVISLIVFLILVFVIQFGEAKALIDGIGNL
jgi:hypothetical protein